MDLLEREPQLQRMKETFKGVLDGQGTIVIVSGEAGIGKTSFVRAVSESRKVVGARAVGSLRSIVHPPPAGSHL